MMANRVHKASHSSILESQQESGQYGDGDDDGNGNGYGYGDGKHTMLCYVWFLMDRVSVRLWVCILFLDDRCILIMLDFSTSFNL